jgi:hypothetical protein
MIGPLIAAGGTLLSGFLSERGAAARQEDAQDFSAQQFASRYQTTVKDMQAAGLNPMLAYSQGGGNAPTSSAASSAGYGDLGSVMNQARMNSAQIANIDADTENKKAQAALIEAQVAQTRASAGSLEAQTNVSNETVTKIKQEVVNLTSENDRIKATVQLLYHQAQNAFKHGLNLTEVGNQLRATISKLQAETNMLGSRDQLNLALEAVEQERAKLLKLDVKAAEDFGNIGREAGQLKPVFDILRSIFRR